MNYRQINTNFWMDEYVAGLNEKELKVFLFLFTNERVNMCGIYEIPDRYINYCLNMEKTELETIKKKFEADSKYAFYKSWVYVVSNHEHSHYSTAFNIIKAFEKELAHIPYEVKDYLFNKKKINYIPPFDKNKIKISIDKEMVMVMKGNGNESSLGGTLRNDTDVNKLEDVKDRLHKGYDGTEDVDPKDIPF